MASRGMATAHYHHDTADDDLDNGVHHVDDSLPDHNDGAHDHVSGHDVHGAYDSVHDRNDGGPDHDDCSGSMR